MHGALRFGRSRSAAQPMRQGFAWPTLCVRQPREAGMDDAPILICSHQIAAHAGCPALIVPPPAREAAI